jgi:MFS family permease
MLSVNLHFFLLFLAFGFAESFGPVYFYKMGLDVSDIAVYWALFFVIRISIRPIIIRLCHKFDLKSVFCTSIILFSGRYLFYSFVQEPGPLMVGLLLYESITSTLYWVIYHSYFAAIASSEKAGVQVATRDMMLLLARLISPFLMSLCLDEFGFGSTFLMAAIVSVSSVLPLIMKPMKEMHIKDFSWKKAMVVDKSGAFLYGVTGIHEYSHLFLWRIALFLQVGSYVGFGALLSLAILFQIIGNFVVGKHFDRSKDTKLPAIGLGIMSLALIGRATISTSIPIILALDILSVLGGVLYGPYISAINYQRSKSSGSTLMFQFWSETGWDFGCIITLSIGAALLSLGAPVKTVMLLGLAGLLGMQMVIKRYRNCAA